jgi:hypothetical protein
MTAMSFRRNSDLVLESRLSVLEVENEKGEVIVFRVGNFQLEKEVGTAQNVSKGHNDWTLTQDVDSLLSFLDRMRAFHNEAIAIFSFLECRLVGLN